MKKSDSLNCLQESEDSGLDWKALSWERTEEGRELRRESMQEGKDYTPFTKRQLVPRDIAGTLYANPNPEKDNLLVSGQTNSTSTPAKCIENDLEIKNSTKETSEKSSPVIYPTMTSSALASLVKVFPLRANVKVFKTSQGELFSSKSSESYEIKDQNTYSLRMLRDYFLTTQAEPSQLYSFHWMNLGMMRNGLSQTLSITYRKTGKGSLSSVLEESVDDKYYLKEEQWKSLKAFQQTAQSAEKTGSSGVPQRQTKEEQSSNVGDAVEIFYTAHAPNSPEKRWGKHRVKSTVCPTIAKDLAIGELKQVGNVDECGHNSIWGRVYDPNGLATNVNAEGGGVGAKTGLYLQEHRVRRLTPVECERLQGFPDGWTEGCSDTQRYRMMGNAVSVPVITDIGKNILKSTGVNVLRASQRHELTQGKG